MQTSDPESNHEESAGTELEGCDEPRCGKDIEETFIENVEDDVECIPAKDVD